MQRSSTFALLLALALYVVAAYIYALIKPMWCDEIWMMIPAANLANNGFLGMGDIRSTLPPTVGAETHIYWYPPLAYVSLAGWFKLWGGYDLMVTRWHSIAWGVVLLAGVYCVGTRWAPKRWTYRSLSTPGNYAGCMWLDDPRWIGIWAVLICVFDYNFLLASDGRPEMMCAALGIWAIATRNAWLAAATCLVHPFGPLYAIALSILKRRVDWVPYLVAAGLWGVYIAQAPDLWWQQVLGIVAVHTTHLAYTPGVGVYIAFGTGWRLVLLGTYVGCAAIMALRQRNIAWCLALLVLPAFFLTRTSYYMPHAVPWLALCVAIQMRKWPWLALILALELAFAVTSLFPLWTWDGIFTLR